MKSHDYECPNFCNATTKDPCAFPVVSPLELFFFFLCLSLTFFADAFEKVV
jgi:hypothetical protein